MSIENKFVLWIDADACPKAVKEVVFKSSGKKNFKVVLVANSYLNIPVSPNISFIQVDKGADVADTYIVEHCNKEDIIITADIPLASLIVEKGALALNPRGEIYTEDNISERLSVRNFMQELRDNDINTDGPAAFGGKDKEKFANSLNKILTKKC